MSESIETMSNNVEMCRQTFFLWITTFSPNNWHHCDSSFWRQVSFLTNLEIKQFFDTFVFRHYYNVQHDTNASNEYLIYNNKTTK